MGNKIRTGILLGRGKEGIHTLHLPRSIWEAACARLSCGYAALGALERQHICTSKSHELSCGYLFDTLVTPTLFYGVETWGLSLSKANHWKDLERPLGSMIPCMIRSKASVPHDIIQNTM